MRTLQYGRRLSILERLRIQLEQAGLATPHTLQPDVSWMADDATMLILYMPMRLSPDLSCLFRAAPVGTRKALAALWRFGATLD